MAATAFRAISTSAQASPTAGKCTKMPPVPQGKPANIAAKPSQPRKACRDDLPSLIVTH
jgi:hypothetical protein